MKDLVIYEVPVRSFTAAESSGLPEGQRGTFLGLAAKADHLIDLGINAVELLPVFEYDELEFQRSPNPRDHMVNIWGYSHISFMAPMSRFAADGGGASAAAVEFKEMVQTCAPIPLQLLCICQLAVYEDTGHCMTEHQAAGHCNQKWLFEDLNSSTHSANLSCELWSFHPCSQVHCSVGYIQRGSKSS